MPFADDEVRIDLVCGRDATGRPHGFFRLHVTAAALWRLGLHPDQPTSGLVTAPLPGWWHAAAERSWHRGEPGPRRRPRAG